MQSEHNQKIIGLILPTASNYFCHTLIDLYEQDLLKKGYQLISATTNHSVEREKEYLISMSNIADGIILMSDAENYDDIASGIKDTPVIFISRKPNGCPHTAIVESDYTAIFQAILSLANDISDKIAFICSKPHLSTTIEQVKAYKAAMETTKSGFNEDLIHYVYTEDCNVANIISVLQDKGCDVFFTCTHSLTEKFMDYIFVYNLKNNANLALAGLSYNKGLTSMQKSIDMVAQPINQIIDLSLQLLFYQKTHPNTISKDYIIKGYLKKRTFDRLSISEIEN